MPLKTPEQLTIEQLKEYTENFQIPFFSRMHFHSAKHAEPSAPLVWPAITERQFAAIGKNSIQKLCHYPEAIPSLEKFDFSGKRCLVIGSSTPWVELFLLKQDASLVFTIEYRPIIWNLSDELSRRWKSYVYSEDCWSQINIKFDCIISYSSLEHSGLGRYGDEIDPNGDLLTIERSLQLSHDQTCWLLGFPVGSDSVLFNRHRVYGYMRLRKIAGILKCNAVDLVKTTFTENEKKILPSGSNNPFEAKLGSDGIQRLMVFRRNRL